MFWKCVLFAVVGYAAYFYGAWAFIGPMICVNFALPAISKLEGIGVVKNVKFLRKKYRLPLLFWAVINAIVAAIVILFVPKTYAIAAGGGAAICILLNLRHTFANGANVGEFISNSREQLNIDSDEDVDGLFSFLLHN